MGNRESATKEEDGKPKEHDQPRLYRHVDIHGGGDLIAMMWQAKNNNDFSLINELIDSKVTFPKFLSLFLNFQQNSLGISVTKFQHPN